ncbi:MAG: beta-propeller fold lactonase family protein [Acidobacteria bacterium]|nr:beta-propeller fold lactonase family protein [Acidobacteriota bacterium]
MTHRSDPPSPLVSRGLALKGWLLVLLLAGPVASGLMTLVEVLRDGVDGVDGLEGVADVKVSPDGLFVYASGQGEDALAVFARDATRETLTFLQVLRNGEDGVFGLAGSSSVAPAPGGYHVYATAFDDDAVGVYRRSTSPPGLVFTGVVKRDGVGGVSGLDGASAAAVSPDGRHLLVTGKLDGALTVFSRDATLDDLALVDLEGGGGVDLAGASSLAFSPEGRHVYVTAEDSDRLVAFRHDPRAHDAGALRYLTEYTEGVGEIYGLERASAVAVSPDGFNVYVTGRSPGSLAVFKRNPGTGRLLLIQAFFTEKGLEGLEGAAAVLASPDGLSVLVASPPTDSVTVFERDPSRGLLALRSVLTDGADGIDGLDGAIALAVSPDRRSFYTAGSAEDALASFHLSLLLRDGFETGDLSRWSGVLPPKDTR